MKKVKLTEQDLTNIVKKVIQEQENSNGEEIDDIINDCRDNFVIICNEISELSLDEIEKAYFDITDNIRNNIETLESVEVKNDKINIIIDDYNELDYNINQIMININNCRTILDNL